MNALDLLKYGITTNDYEVVGKALGLLVGENPVNSKIVKKRNYIEKCKELFDINGEKL